MYVDNTFAEACWTGGRVARTNIIEVQPEAVAAAVGATAGCKLVHANAWTVGSV